MVRRRRGLTVVELIVVIAIAALLQAILLPALARSREQVRLTVCLGNMRNQAAAFIGYAADADGSLPTAISPVEPWAELCRMPNATARTLGDHGLEDGPEDMPTAADIAEVMSAWRCPSAEAWGLLPTFHAADPGFFGIDHYYVLTGLSGNGFYRGRNSPARTHDPPGVLTADRYLSWDPGATQWIGFHGAGPAGDATGLNQSYLDGHAAWVDVAALPEPQAQWLYRSPSRYITWLEP